MSTFTLEPNTTALVLIDLQKGIASRPGAPHSAEVVIERAVKLSQAFRAKKCTVFLVHVLISEIATPLTDTPPTVGAPLSKEASEFVEAMTPQPGDVVITKKQWGAFYGTNLEQELRRRGIKTIVLGGIATNYGVESTAREAYEKGFNQIFVEDAMTTIDAESHAFAFAKIFPRLGRIRSCDQVCQAIGQN